MTTCRLLLTTALCSLLLSPAGPARADEPSDEPDVIRGGGVEKPPERKVDEGKAGEPASSLGPGWWQVSAPADVGYRIVSFGFTLVGPGFFLVSAPVAAVRGVSGLEGALETLVVCPFKYTFVHPWRRHRACPEQLSQS